MDFVTTLFQGPLLVFTIPMLLAVLFWLTAVIGLLDVESLDLELDADVDVDLDVDPGAGADLAGGGGVLHLLGLGLIPFSLILSLVLFFFGWSGIALHGLLGDRLGWSGPGLTLLFVPLALVAALAVSAGASRLLHPLFKDYGAAHGAFDLVGKIASLNSNTVSPSFGSATVKVEGDLLEIAARCDDEGNTLRYGDRVLVIDYDPQKNIYHIAPYDED